MGLVGSVAASGKDALFAALAHGICSSRHEQIGAVDSVMSEQIGQDHRIGHCRGEGKQVFVGLKNERLGDGLRPTEERSVSRLVPR